MLGSRRTSRRLFRNAATPRRNVVNYPRLEELETRTLLSTAVLAPITSSLAMHPQVQIDPAFTPGEAPLIPSEMRGLYGVNKVQFFSGGSYVTGNGAGETIAIVDADNDPTIVADLATFDSVFGLPAPASFHVLNQNGTTITNQTGSPTSPRNSPHSSWSIEESLDVEWAHTIAPAANIVLFEANSSSFANLGTAVESAARASVYTALGIPAATVISNSYGSTEVTQPNGSGGTTTGISKTTEQTDDATYYAPISNNNTISLVFSTGDDDTGDLGQEYPATSPYVLAVGGTSATLNVGPFGVSYGGETTWNDVSQGYGSGAGGTSLYESIPSYQSEYGIGGTNREIPDVSMSASLESGVYITDSYDFSVARGAPATTLGTVFGTSLAAPMWAGLIAITNQGRALAGEAPIGNVQEAVYGVPASDFHDITSGTNGESGSFLVSAGPGYDEATGIGSPIANKLIPDLVNFTGTAPIAFFNLDTSSDGSADQTDTMNASINVGRDFVTEGSAANAAVSVSAVQANSVESVLAPESLAGRSLASNPVTVAIPSTAQVVRTDTTAEATALPIPATSHVEGFRGTLDASLAGSTSDPVPTEGTQSTTLARTFESGPAAVASPAVTPAAVSATADSAAALPTAAASASDAAFADFGTLQQSPAPSAVIAGEETHSVDLAMIAGLALVLGGLSSAPGRQEETRKVPALRR